MNYLHTCLRILGIYLILKENKTTYVLHDQSANYPRRPSKINDFLALLENGLQSLKAARQKAE